MGIRRHVLGLALVASSLLAAFGVTAQRAAAGQGEHCSARQALLSVDRIFRGLETGNAKLALSGFMRPRGDLPAWGINIERDEKLRGARESALNAVTPAQIRRLAAQRAVHGERLDVLDVVISLGQDWGSPQKDRVVPIGVLYTRRADDFPNAQGFGDRGGAKGSFSCTSGRVMWLRGGHGAMTKPLGEHAPFRCGTDRRTVQCVTVRGVGSARAFDGCAATPSPCS